MKPLALVWLAAAFCLPSFAGLPAFHLHDTSGAEHSSGDWAGYKAVVLYFTTVDCPVANSYVPEMNRIHDAYAARGVLFLAVQSDTTVATPDVVRYAKEFQYSFPLLLDPHQILVQSAGASVTPQAAVLNADGKVLYLGRVDNRVQDFGQQRLNATVFDLRDAIEAVLAGKPVAHPLTKSIGCAITRTGSESK
ncbi:MAG TPA: thioredoxin family protein [Verrucomicrobiae bacterium]|nr:thioredoxin family protein [Verrucomicrobiae bacterium]